MGLGKYFSKRHFKKTPEPKGKITHRTPKSLAFVVQEHHASHLHWDFRLECDGVLKSWAIPKGPSTNPHVRHLAMQVEDHPYEYRNFEGVIPEGNYGAGEVIIWDQGTFEPRTPSDDPQATMRRDLKKGHFTFVMHGQKLKGEYALIKLHGGEKRAWLLVKKDDEWANEDEVTAQDESVVSGKTAEDLAQTPSLDDAPKAKMPAHITPMLTTLIDTPFTKEEWLFEMKWDGYRAIGTKQGDEIELYSRNQLDFSARYPRITEALRTFKDDVVVDGEIVVLDEKGRPHFERLQNWRRTQEGTLVYYVFDILWCNGRDVRGLPLLARKKLLQSVLPKNPALLYSEHVAVKGEALFAEVQKLGLEGIVAKKADSVYQDGVRTQNWLKIKTHLRQEVVIGGFTEGRGTRTHIGALLLGVYEKGELVFVGHANAGIPDDTRRELRRKLDRLERQSSPFQTEPKPNAVVHWVSPKLVGEVVFSEWTKEGMMRQPEFKGLRPDKPAGKVHREKPKARKLVKAVKESTPAPASSRSRRSLSLTHLDKIFWPELKLTKGDLIHYYEAVGPTMLPYLLDRPHSLLRQPNGYKDRGFFQKDMSPLKLPSFTHTKTIFSESTNENVKYLVVKNIETLLYMVQLGSIEINPWSSRVPHLTKPDWAVMDLDPEGVTFKEVIAVAKTVHEVCEEWHIPHFPKTSGKTGIHIFIPLGANYSYEQAKNFVHLIALEVNRRQPKLTSLERIPKNRPHKIYLDYLQNNEGQTLAAPYSARPTKAASVSAPLHWDEVNNSLKPENFTIKNMPARIAQTGDLWKPLLGHGVDLKKILADLTQE